MKTQQPELRAIPQFDLARWKLRLERVPVHPQYLHRKLPLREENGAIVKWFGSSLDLQNRRIAEDEVRQMVGKAPPGASEISSLVIELRASGNQLALGKLTCITHEKNRSTPWWLRRKRIAVMKCDREFLS